jgi:hypothetical protein
MLAKQTAWLFAKALVIGMAISLYLVYMGSQPADPVKVTQHLAAMIFW